MPYSVQNFEAFIVDDELSGFLLQGQGAPPPPQKKNDFCPP